MVDAKNVARERISDLFSLSLTSVKTDPVLARLYVKRALRISQKYKVRLGRENRRCYCKGCYTPLVSGISAIVRLTRRTKHLVRQIFICTNCGKIKFSVLKN